MGSMLASGCAGGARVAAAAYRSTGTPVGQGMGQLLDAVARDFESREANQRFGNEIRAGTIVQGEGGYRPAEGYRWVSPEDPNDLRVMPRPAKEYYSGKMHDGGQYDGFISAGRPHGWGLYVWTDGDKYCGDFRMGQKHGQGTFTFADGRVISGIWSDNQIVDGILTIRDGSGRTVRYLFRNGQSAGEVK